MSSHVLARFSTVVATILLATALLCCTSKESATPLDDEARAGGVALKCYKALYIENRAETFLNGSLSYDSLSSEQRQQLLTFYNQHVAQVGREHGGVNSIDFLRAESDTALNVMQVFLKMTFTDNTQEEVVVPMVQTDGEWKMK